MFEVEEGGGMNSGWKGDDVAQADSLYYLRRGCLNL